MNSGKLQFTGNWYFDCGIIGFLSIIDEVFGEDRVNRILSEINICRKNNTLQFDEELNRDFFKAYWICYTKEQIDKLGLKKGIKDEANKLITINDINNFIEKLSNFSRKCTKNKKEIIRKNMSAFYKNFAFFNKKGSKNILESSKKYFFDYENYKNKEKSIAVESIERAINKFLLSYEEFKNEFFDRPLKIEEIENQLNIPLHIFLACTEKGFANFSNSKIKEKIFVHTPSIEASWKIHKKLKILKERFLKQKENSYNIFSLTTDSIIDALYEEKSEWVLRNLLVITYQYISTNQEIIGVKFLPFNKDEATLLKKQNIRRYALRNIEITRNNKSQLIYGIDGLIHKRFLSSFIVEYIKTQIRGGKK